MPRYASYSDSETDFSETDESIIEIPRRRRTALRRRSISRHRRSPDYRNSLLVPAPPPDVAMHRSLSTGGGRRRREAPAVVVDIQNDTRNKSSNRNPRLSSRHLDVIDVSDEAISADEILRSHRRRHRASTSLSRDHSQSPNHRDYELLVDQRILEKNDARQDMELMKQQQEIERLERELARRREGRGSHGHRLLREEEEWYEDEIRDRLRKLDRLERKQQMEEERRRAEYRAKMKQYEEDERLAREREEVRAKLREEKLKLVLREKEEEEEKERIKQEIRDEEARKKLEEEEKRKKMMKLKQEAVAEWKLMEEAKQAEAQKAKEEKDKEFRERLKCEFGYSEEEIEKILARRKAGEERKEEKTLIKEKEYEKTTWIKVHRRHLLPETLIAYRLPWDWDDRDSNYIIIKQWISEELQEELFAHTRRLREGKLVTETSSSLTELKVNDRRKDKMYLVRKKSPSRRWIFTT